ASEPARSPDRASDAPAGTGRELGAVRLSATDGAVETRGLGGECGTELSLVQGRRVDGADQGAPEDRAAPARAASAPNQAERALGPGLCQRPSGGWALVPGPDRGRPVHPRV